jgi:phage baseplate assembly protein W
VTRFAFPFHVDSTGRTAVVDEAQYVEQLIRQVLLTIPGERVNRPTFGSPAMTLVFTATTAAEGTTLQFLMQSALQTGLGDLIRVEGLEAQTVEDTLTLTIQYVLRRTGERHVLQLGEGQ